MFRVFERDGRYGKAEDPRIDRLIPASECVVGNAILCQGKNQNAAFAARLSRLLLSDATYSTILDEGESTDIRSTVVHRVFPPDSVEDGRFPATGFRFHDGDKVYEVSVTVGYVEVGFRNGERYSQYVRRFLTAEGAKGLAALVFEAMPSTDETSRAITAKLEQWEAKRQRAAQDKSEKREDEAE